MDHKQKLIWKILFCLWKYWSVIFWHQNQTVFVEIVKISGEPHASTFEIIVVLYARAVWLYLPTYVNMHFVNY